MKGVVLAGGLGTRLLPMTRVTNKHLLPVYDRPMIYYPLQQLVHAGVDDVLVVTGGDSAGDFLKLLRNGNDFGLDQLRYAYQEGEGGIAEALGLAEFFAAGEPIVVILGDNIFQDSLAGAIAAFREEPSGAMILLKEVDDPERFGVATVEGERVLGIVEKPTAPPSRLAVTGCYLYDARVFDVIRTLRALRSRRARDHRREQPLHRVGRDALPPGVRVVDRRGHGVVPPPRRRTGRRRPGQPGADPDAALVRYLVTGGAGFIGSNFVRHLLAERADAEVLNLDALTYAGHLESLADVEHDARYGFVHGDICDGSVVSEVLSGVDVVFNLAAESHVDRSIVEDAPFVRTNVLGTATLLAAALAEGVSRFVQVSTDEVYGELPWRDPEDGDEAAPRFTEETPVAPRSPYSASKAAADHLALAYHTTHGMDVVVTRCSNNYGPYQYPEKLIPVMITRAAADESLPVYGDGLYVRDWIHVRDHCAGLLAAAERGRAGSVYNMGASAERTNLGVAREVLRLLGKPGSLIEHVEDRPGHDRRYAIDASKAERELGWSASIRFEEGLRETVDWYLEHADWCRAVTRKT